jgi:hypothetical protein
VKRKSKGTASSECVERKMTEELKFLHEERNLFFPRLLGKGGELQQGCGCGYAAHTMLLSKAVCNL